VQFEVIIAVLLRIPRLLHVTQYHIPEDFNLDDAEALSIDLDVQWILI
jgi:hypothetical protein